MKRLELLHREAPDPKSGVGEDYGKTNGKIENKVYYNKAQAALQANTSYAEALLQKQEVNKVDGISGATDSYILFFDAAQKALEAAERG